MSREAYWVPMQEKIETDIQFLTLFRDLGPLYKQIGRGLTGIPVQKRPNIRSGMLRHRQPSALWFLPSFLPSIPPPEM